MTRLFNGIEMAKIRYGTHSHPPDNNTTSKAKNAKQKASNIHVNKKQQKRATDPVEYITCD